MRATKSVNSHAGSSPERRAFFSLFLGTDDSAVPATRKPLPAERIALLREVAARWKGTLPAGSVMELQVGAACAHHGGCVAVCPTAALRPYSNDGVAGLEFDAAACIGCGVCALVCPENAMTLRAVSAAPALAAQPVSRHAVQLCARCDDEFAVRGDEELCPACRKDVQLFTTGFSAGSNEP
jgi:Fe-S-cluster-containing dehydrogenase component